MSSFAEKLRYERKKRRMTQKDLADRLGVSTRTIVSYEKGASVPHNKKLQALAEIFGKSPEYFNISENSEKTTSDHSESKKDPNEDENSKTENDSKIDEQKRAKAESEAEFIKMRATALFAGGDLPQSAKDKFFSALYDAYLSCRDAARDDDSD